MEQNQNALFSLTIDPVTKNHLSETAKWARFLAIIGMIFMVLAAIGIIYFVYQMTAATSAFEEDYEGGLGANPFGGIGMGIAVFYIILLIIWFFPLLFMLRFANKMKHALNGNDQQALNVSFQNLKVCFRYIGIITIIILVLYAIAFLIAILSSQTM